MRAVVMQWAALAAVGAFSIVPAGFAQSGTAMARQKVIIDTDIGDDIDDVLAVGLALESKEVEVIGLTAAWGDTKLRARMLVRLLKETGHTEIPVAVGIEKHHAFEGKFTQARWAEREPEKPHVQAVDFMLEQIRKYPGEVTLIGIGPLTNVAAAIDRDAAAFKKLKRIVIMGGSVRRGYSDLGFTKVNGPSAEYNIAMDPEAAQKVFASGVPLYVMPLDSTLLKLDEVKRPMLFTASTPLTDALTLLYHQWSAGTGMATPTMFDAVAVAYAIDPAQCPVTPLRLSVDAKGFTREEQGEPNTFVCLESDSDKFFKFYLPRLMGSAK